MKLRAASLFAAASLLASSAFAQTGNDVMIGGFIIQGTGPKSVIVRAIGPELTPLGIPNALADPTLELHNGTGALIASNDNWQTTVIGGIITSNQVSAIQNSGHAPTQSSESAIIATLPPGNYTAIVRGRNNTIGVGLVEVYDLNPNTTSVLDNISTRAFVQTGNDVMIGGFIVQGTGPKRVILRAIGPELSPFGIPNALADPTLELHNGTGALIASNDNWQTTVIGGIITGSQVSAIQDSGHAPTQPGESAIIATLPPGNYTAIVRGSNNSVGVALVEVYDLDPDAGSVLSNISTRASLASDVQTMPFAQLTASDVQTIINHAVTRAAAISPNSVIAVTDREGDVLGVWVMRGGNALSPEIATAVSKAGTASYLSSDQNAFTSRTAGFIIQQHFPPGVINTATGPLVGVGLSNLFFSDINTFRGPGSVIVNSATPGAIMPPQYPQIKPVGGSSLDGTPGGVPLYKNGQLAGGLGVTGDGIPGPITGFRAENPFIFIAGYDKDEDIALAGQNGYAPASSILATNVFINGIRLPYVNSSTVFSNITVPRGNADSHYPISSAPAPFPYPVATLGGVPGQIRQPIQNDPLPGTINGQPRLTAAEVTSILSRAAHRTCITRAGIRLPVGVSMKAFITVVNNPNADGMAPMVLGTFRTGEATLFSWDVAVQKARTVMYYSTHDFLNFGVRVAMSVRCVGFLAQCNYPPGIDGNSQGPFNGQQEMFSGLLGNHCQPAGITANPSFQISPNLPNGITIFPGAFGLYRNGVLVGAIGVSGDGVDQDDLVAAEGCHDFLAPFAIRSDQFFLSGARLPYAKFPRDPAISCQ